MGKHGGIKSLLLIASLVSILGCKEIIDKDRTIEKWDNGVINYYFDPGLSSIAKESIRFYMDEWEKVANIEFIESGEETSDVYHISPCVYWSSTVGSNNKENQICVDKAAKSKGDMLKFAMHELGHGLGLTHEHQRPDRDEYIIVDWEFIEAKGKFDYKIVNNPLIDLDSEYDCKSIMHYRGYEYSTDGESTIQFKDKSSIDCMGFGLTELDIAKIQLIYGEPK